MPTSVLKPFHHGPLIPPPRAVWVLEGLPDGAIARADLTALVAMLQHEHFAYDGAGAAAARALKGLTAALETGQGR